MNTTKSTYHLYKSGLYTGVTVVTKEEALRIVQTRKAIGQRWSYKYGYITADGIFVPVTEPK